MGIASDPIVLKSNSPEQSKSQRLLPIDALRGLALIAMSLDHAAASVWVSLQAETYGGQSAILASWPYWIAGLFTNIAAPTFWFLSGVSLALFTAGRKRRGVTEGEITRHFLIRSLVIIVLDLTLCWMAWSGKTPYLHVLLSIGFCLMIMSFTRRIGIRLFFILTTGILFMYQLALPMVAASLSQTRQFLPAFFLSYSTVTVPAVEFSILGWGTLMGLGFVVGQKASSEWFQRSNTWLFVGIILLVIWFVFRLWGFFGDLTPRQPGQPWYYFLMMSKTPPSLTFLCFNLGIASILLAGLFQFNRFLKKKPYSWIVICGQVSLFYFVAHIVGYGLLGRVVRWIELPVPDIILAIFTWLLGLAILVPITIGYKSLRSRHPGSILRFL
jgi:uncharacterized membrane protein